MNEILVSEGVMGKAWVTWIYAYQRSGWLRSRFKPVFRLVVADISQGSGSV